MGEQNALGLKEPLALPLPPKRDSMPPDVLIVLNVAPRQSCAVGVAAFTGGVSSARIDRSNGVVVEDERIPILDNGHAGDCWQAATR